MESFNTSINSRNTNISIDQRQASIAESQGSIQEEILGKPSSGEESTDLANNIYSIAEHRASLEALKYEFLEQKRLRKDLGNKLNTAA